MGRVLVVGSVNLDLVYRVPHLPRPGETLLGGELVRLSGGKGGNQAHAAARIAPDGVAVAMVACVGADDAGSRLRAELAAAGVDVDGFLEVTEPSGTALIAVDDAGENTIVVVPGANAAWPAGAVDGIRMLAGDIVVVQLEVPFDIVVAVVARAASIGARVVLNAAPFDPRVAEILDRVDVLSVNEGEALELLGGDADIPLDGPAVRAAAARFGTSLVVTLGARGAIVATPEYTWSVPAYPVEAVDTVGAGDAFVGGLAAGLAAGESLETAVRQGSATGALTATVAGARHPKLSRNAVRMLLESGE